MYEYKVGTEYGTNGWHWTVDEERTTSVSNPSPCVAWHPVTTSDDINSYTMTMMNCFDRPTRQYLGNLLAQLNLRFDVIYSIVQAVLRS